MAFIVAGSSSNAEAAQDAVGTALVDSASIDFTYDDGANSITATVIQAGIDHGSIGGLSDDDHSQYALLAGRSGGQILYGSTAASENLTLRSTSHATKGNIIVGDQGGHLQIGGAATASEARFMEPSGSGTNYTALKAQAQASNITYTLPAAQGAADEILKNDGSGGLSWVANTRSVGISIDGAGSAITTGVKGYIEIPYDCTITGWTLLADQSGSCVIDVWKDTYANYPPTVADTITGSEKPTLSSATKNQDLSLSTWTTAVTAGDILGFNVDSASTVTRAHLIIRVVPT